MNYDISPTMGSHASVLGDALAALEPDALVIEHGCGLYSSPLIQLSGHRVVCIEAAKGWRSWAAWLYGSRGNMLEHAKQAIPLLADAGLVFVDGAKNERGDLLYWALESRVPCIIAHDTEDDARKQYGYMRHHFTAPGYTVVSYGDVPRTTMWRLQ